MQNATQDLINYKLRMANNILEGIEQDMAIMQGLADEVRTLLEEQKSG